MTVIYTGILFFFSIQPTVRINTALRNPYDSTGTLTRDGGVVCVCVRVYTHGEGRDTTSPVRKMSFFPRFLFPVQKPPGRGALDEIITADAICRVTENPNVFVLAEVTRRSFHPTVGQGKLSIGGRLFYYAGVDKRFQIHRRRGCD